MTLGRPPSNSPSLKRNDLANELGKELGTFSAGAKVVHAFFDEIVQSLIAGEPVSIHGLGRFRIITKGIRKGRNPKSGEEKLIQERKVVSFKPSLKMRNKLRDADLARPADD